jgi:hypothetical protein
MSFEIAGSSLSMPSLSQSATFIKNAGSNFVDNMVAKFKLKPKDAVGINGFVFDFEGEDTVVETAEITDHYSETNQSIQDHVAIKPEKIILRGFVSELTYTPPGGLLGTIDILQDKLTVVNAYLGKYTPGAVAKVQAAITKVQNVANDINQTISRVQNVAGLFQKANPAVTKQQMAYAQLYSMMVTKQIFSVETPYDFHPNMVIESLNFLQDETTKTWSDIIVTLKQMRFVNTETSTSASERTSLQSQKQVLTPEMRGTNVDVASMSGLQNGIALPA